MLLYCLLTASPFAEHRSWSQGASVEAKASKSYRHSAFEHYDAITFVVIVLNFLREDASPLLTPTPAQEGAPEGLSGELRCEQNIDSRLYVRRTACSLYRYCINSTNTAVLIRSMYVALSFGFPGNENQLSPCVAQPTKKMSFRRVFFVKLSTGY